MDIYFDTEFISIQARIKNIRLISAGFVSETGQEFYFELPQNYKKVDCSNFVADTVLPNLVNTEEVSLGNIDAISNLRSWVEGFEGEVVFCCDAPNFDWVLLSKFIEAMGEKLPRNLIAHPKNVYSDAVCARMNEYFDSNLEAIRHNALWDARALAYACKAE